MFSVTNTSPPLATAAATSSGVAVSPPPTSVYAQVYRQIDSIKKAKVESDMLLREREELVHRYSEEIEDMYQREMRSKVRTEPKTTRLDLFITKTKLSI